MRTRHEAGRLTPSALGGGCGTAGGTGTRAVSSPRTDDVPVADADAAAIAEKIGGLTNVREDMMSSGCTLRPLALNPL